MNVKKTVDYAKTSFLLGKGKKGNVRIAGATDYSRIAGLGFNKMINDYLFFLVLVRQSYQVPGIVLE